MERLLTLLLSCFLLLETTAQDAGKELQNKMNEVTKQDLANRIRNWKVQKDTNDVLRHLGFLEGKPGVYRLPQDNMPCIVPDSSKTVKIPNAWKGPKRIPYRSNPPRIPNIAKPWVPTPITNTTTASK